MEKQKKQIPDSLAVICGLLVLLALGIAALIAHGGEFSEWERRYLANRPAVSLENWKTDKDTESFLTDHIPGRQALVALDSSVQFLTGRNTQLGAWYASGALVEQPVRAATGEIEKKLRRFGKIADEAGVPWLLLSPRTHGYLMRDRMIPVIARTYDQEEENYTFLESYPNMVTMPEAFNADPESMYYKTDHHWAGLGAFYVQRLMMRTFGVPSAAYEDFEYTVHEDFAGSIAAEARSLAGKKNLVDRLEVPTALAPARAFVYKNLNQLVKEVRYMEPERKVYAAFLGGTHSPFYVAQTGFHTGRNALVICDSFGLAFVVYAAPYYDNVCLADLRETNLFVTGGGASLREYIQYYDIDDVYFIVSRGCGINSAYMQKTVVKYLG